MEHVLDWDREVPTTEARDAGLLDSALEPLG